MTLNEYTISALETWNPEHFHSSSDRFLYLVTGLASEAGEVAGQAKRVLRDDDTFITPERRAKLIDELGDVLWYLSVLADFLGVSLDNVAQRNIQKLTDRKLRGVINGEGDNR